LGVFILLFFSSFGWRHCPAILNLLRRAENKASKDPRYSDEDIQMSCLCKLWQDKNPTAMSQVIQRDTCRRLQGTNHRRLIGNPQTKKKKRRRRKEKKRKKQSLVLHMKSLQHQQPLPPRINVDR
jgi:hypothetical protein